MNTKQISAHKRNQIKYMLVAFFVASFGGIDYIPNYGYEIYPFGYIFIFAMFCIIAYAIVRHQLLDIEVIIKKTLIFGGIFASVYAVFAFFAFMGQTFFERYVTANRWIAMIPSVVVVTLMLRPLENLLINVTDKCLFQKKYSYKELLKAFAEEVLTVIDLERLKRLTNDKIAKIMKLEFCDMVVTDTGGAINKSNAEIKIPITMHNRELGVLLLGKKKSNEEYTKDDLDILNPLAKTLSIAISNAKLFDELAKAQAAAAQKDKMATIGTLAAGMAHEIRNPLTTIRNFADYLPERYNDKIFINKFDSIIPREIERIESIARSMLEFSSSEGDRSEESFGLKSVIKTALSLLEPQYRSSEIKVSGECKGGCMIKARKVQIQDGIFNIIKYIFAESPKGSNISINITENKNNISASIRNKNLVVGEHIIKDIFEPLSGLYREKMGFGFDLFIAKELIERNSGTLSINSDRESGAEFRIGFKR